MKRGFGLADSAINLHYITSPYCRATAGVSVAERKFEYPKRSDLQPLYCYLATLAYNNFLTINR